MNTQPTEYLKIEITELNQKDGHEAQCAAWESIFTSDGQRCCEKCGNELNDTDAFLCTNCESVA